MGSVYLFSYRVQMGWVDYLLLSFHVYLSFVISDSPSFSLYIFLSSVAWAFMLRFTPFPQHFTYQSLSRSLPFLTLIPISLYHPQGGPNRWLPNASPVLIRPLYFLFFTPLMRGRFHLGHFHSFFLSSLPEFLCLLFYLLFYGWETWEGLFLC